LYRNDNALPLGFLAVKEIYNVRQPLNDNLGSLTNLLNALANTNERYFTFYQQTMTLQNNVTITQNTAGVTFTEKQH
ncbi:YfhO family protein, partial [Enterococcus faecalis]|uniref:YfhO family protein n=1 Tax=Enterococcus faecalis TaxID=1351 RepID=UPI003CC51D7D